MPTIAHIENMVTLVVCACLIAGLYALGAGDSSLWALLVLLNLNVTSRERG